MAPRWSEELLQTSSLPRWSSWTAATSRMSSTRWPLEKLSFARFDGGIPQREWRMVAQALSVPRYDFAMAHIPTSRSVQPQIWQEPLTPLSQAGHKLDMQETLGYNLGKLGTIFTVQIAQLWPDWSTLFLLWELLLFIQRLDTLETHFEWPRNLKLKYFC